MKKIYMIMLLPILIFGAATKIYTTGETFEFAENDMLEDIQKTIEEKRPELEKKLTELKEGSKEKITNFKPKDMIAMTPAIKDNIFYPDMRYTNPENIYDNDGKVIYPKGFTFNPLDFQIMHTQIIVIDGSSKDEIQWLQNNGYTDNMRYKILLSDGNYQEVSKKLKQPVFYCIPKITQKFQLKHTPSIITQVGNTLKVKEICINCIKKAHK